MIKTRRKIIKEIYGEIKYLPETYEAPISTIIYGDKIAIITWPEKNSFCFRKFRHFKGVQEVLRSFVGESQRLIETKILKKTVDHY